MLGARETLHVNGQCNEKCPPEGWAFSTIVCLRGEAYANKSRS